MTDIPTVPAAAKNPKITLIAGTGLTGGGDFTLNQSAAEDITINHPTTAGNKHIPTGGNTDEYLKWSGTSGTAVWATVPAGGGGGDFYKDGSVAMDGDLKMGNKNIRSCIGIGRPTSMTPNIAFNASNIMFNTDIFPNSNPGHDIGSTSYRWGDLYAETGDFSGNVTAVAFFESSLRALKTNITPFEKSGLDLVKSLDIYNYDRKDGSANNKIGIMIDESPEEFANDERTKVDLYKTIFVQAKAIQELEERLSKLEKLI